MKPIKPLYCVYYNGIGEYITDHLAGATRWVANRLGKPTGKCTDYEAVAAGYSIRII